MFAWNTRSPILTINYFLQQYALKTQKRGRQTSFLGLSKHCQYLRHIFDNNMTMAILLQRAGKSKKII